MSELETRRLREYVVELSARLDEHEKRTADNFERVQSDSTSQRAVLVQLVATLREEVYVSMISMVQSAVDASRGSLLDFINNTIESALIRYKFKQL